MWRLHQRSGVFLCVETFSGELICYILVREGSQATLPKRSEGGLVGNVVPTVVRTDGHILLQKYVDASK